MTIRHEFVQDIREHEEERFAQAGLRPVIEFWPDDFAEWVAAHENPVAAVVCNTPEFSSSPFCGRGYH